MCARAGRQLTFTDRTDAAGKKVIEAEAVEAPNRGPYPFNQPKRNTVPFTPAQVGDARTGSATKGNPGLIGWRSGSVLRFWLFA